VGPKLLVKEPFFADDDGLVVEQLRIVSIVSVSLRYPFDILCRSRLHRRHMQGYVRTLWSILVILMTIRLQEGAKNSGPKTVLPLQRFWDAWIEREEPGLSLISHVVTSSDNGS